MPEESRPTRRRDPAQTERRGTLTGARLIPLRSQAIRATLSVFTDFEVAYHFPYSHEYELIPRIQMAWGRNRSSDPSFLELGTDARKEFLNEGKWTVAGFASLFLHLNTNEDDKVHQKLTGPVGIGIPLPGAVATYAIKPDWDLNLGAQLQPIFYMGDDLALELNMPFFVGFELALNKEIVIVQRTEFGPDFYLGKKTKPQHRTYVGAGIHF